MPLLIEKFDANSNSFVFTELVQQSDNPYRIPNILDSGEHELYLIGTKEDDKSSFIQRVQPLNAKIQPIKGEHFVDYNEEEVFDVTELNLGQEIELFIKLSNQTPLVHIRLTHV